MTQAEARKESDPLPRPAAHLSLKVSAKGAVSLYGLGRFPVTLYKNQWLKVFDKAGEIRAFIAQNEKDLATRPTSEASSSSKPQ